MARVFDDWAPRIHAAIITGAGRSNVTEWCKKEESWHYIKVLELALGEVPPEVVTDTADVEAQVPQGANGDYDLVELCCTVDSVGWTKIIAWAAENGRLPKFDQRVALTLASYALQGWQKRPSIKQARIGARVLRAAADAGLVELPAG
jgi:hypothetical protein